MSVFDPADIEYPFTVTVTRPSGSFDGEGNYQESAVTVTTDLPADIQLSLKIRSLTTRDDTGATDNAVWTMFCNPPAPILRGDRVSDGSRSFVVDAVGDWSSHLECLLRLE